MPVPTVIKFNNNKPSGAQLPAFCFKQQLFKKC